MSIYFKQNFAIVSNEFSFVLSKISLQELRGRTTFADNFAVEYFLVANNFGDPTSPEYLLLVPPLLNQPINDAPSRRKQTFKVLAVPPVIPTKTTGSARHRAASITAASSAGVHIG